MAWCHHHRQHGDHESWRCHCPLNHTGFQSSSYGYSHLMFLYSRFSFSITEGTRTIMIVVIALIVIIKIASIQIYGAPMSPFVAFTAFFSHLSVDCCGLFLSFFLFGLPYVFSQRLNETKKTHPKQYGGWGPLRERERERGVGGMGWGGMNEERVKWGRVEDENRNRGGWT